MAAASLKAPGSPWKAMRRDVECWGEFAVLGDDDAGDCDDDGFGVGGSGCNEAGSLGQTSVLTALRHQV